MTDDATLKRIQALIAKAEGTDNEHEAQAFYGKAEELMAKYAIDEAMLEAAGGGRREDPVVDKFAYAGQVYRPAKVTLLDGLAKLNNVRMVMYQGHRDGSFGTRTFFAALIGFPSDVNFTKLLYTSIGLQAERSAEREFKTHGGVGFSSAYVWKHSYVQGFVAGALQKMREAKARTQDEAMTIAERQSPGTELVLRSKAEAVDAALADAFPKLGKARGGSRERDYGAYGSGQRDGRRADVSGGRGHVGGRRAIQ